ncbi:MAG: hypothetical protein H5U36_05585, partial [Candidatus Caldatribacterium sp.]|nr:hypothetical protein [Candidatus Caldatribacterium sp.]
SNHKEELHGELSNVVKPLKPLHMFRREELKLWGKRVYRPYVLHHLKDMIPKFQGKPWIICILHVHFNYYMNMSGGSFPLSWLLEANHKVVGRFLTRINENLHPFSGCINAIINPNPLDPPDPVGGSKVMVHYQGQEEEFPT